MLKLFDFEHTALSSRIIGTAAFATFMFEAVCRGMMYLPVTEARSLLGFALVVVNSAPEPSFLL
jgi:hypothetical protein